MTSVDKLRPFQPIMLAFVAAGMALGTIWALLTESRVSGGISVSQSSYLTVANALLLFAVIVLTLIYVDSRRVRLRAAVRREAKVGLLLRHILNLAGARTTLSLEALEESSDENGIAIRAERTSEFLQFVVNEARTTFDEYTEHSCAVAIKLLVPGDDGVPRVLTYLRDDRSGPIRRRMYGEAHPYPYTDHSPFVDLVEPADGIDFFLENNLRRAAREGRYRNSNPHRPRLYNATLVVPINPPGLAPGEGLVGFLCVDSLRARFDLNVCPSVARVFAGSAFLAISELNSLQRQAQAGNQGDKETEVARCT